ncbi:hypothetical protein QO199_23240 [Serratia bockelmannii]|uniref:Uncharacterized protein n=1 Tax=Serratia bockelmannii TaxID=2703793 RepID=A0ABT8LY71_9GAMM|nr:hypothetical protein [Serratia bockelmannii]MDN6881559.1 hypothetical protein [Serratia bockelmannii]HBH6890245.1 hypothetical protein [Serratia marcescens]
MSDIIMKIFSFLFFIVFTSINGFLLYMDKFTSGEAIAFFALYSVISLMFFFSSEVQEFSIAGNMVKLKEVRRDADKAIAELKASRVAMFKFLLEISKKTSGGFGSISPKDERVDDFVFLYENIKSSGLINELSEEISGCAKMLMKSLVENNLSYYTKVDSSQTYKPDQLTIEALNNILTNTVRTEEENMKSIMEVISYYRTLYDIFQIARSYKY